MSQLSTQLIMSAIKSMDVNVIFLQDNANEIIYIYHNTSKIGYILFIHQG